MEKPVILQKEKQVSECLAQMQEAQAFLAVEYHGLTVADITELRHQLRETGSTMVVIKNNISRRAADKAGYTQFGETLVGPKAIIFNNTDVVAPAKVAFKYASGNDKLVIGCGVVNGEFYDNAKLKQLSTLPSYETLLTQLAGGLLAPVRDLAVGLNLYVEKLEEANA